MDKKVKALKQVIDSDLTLLVQLALSFLTCDLELTKPITEEERNQACQEALLSYILFTETGEKFFLFSERTQEIVDEIIKDQSFSGYLQ